MTSLPRFANGRLLAAAAAVAALGLAVPAQASVVLNYSDFTGACGNSLTCVGNTAEAGSALRVTPSAAFQSGAGYSTTAISLGASATFSTTFQFRFTSPGGIAPADGITFVLAQSATGLGAAGGGLGYQGVQNSVAIEFDTYNNGEVGGSNHVAIDKGGVLTNAASASPYGVTTCDFNTGLGAGCMANGNVWTATITYDGSLLNVFLRDGNNPLQHLITDFAIDIAAELGTNTAFVGFTGGTGSGQEAQDVLNWTLANDTSITPPTDVPEPSALALAGLALLGLRATRRKA